jgi:hypothetical protein
MIKKFPEYLHRPFQVLWWEVDELGLYTVALVIGMIFEHILAWIIPIFLVTRYSAYKKRYPRGFIKHFLYFTGLVKLEGYPDYWVEKFNE